ncbi:MAG TPA: hypothetical protein VGM88_26210 [Kofleriaceae bacterium]|jgi:flagellar biosynthesis protein FlhF
MRVKKFEGATMRDAIAKVKAELGDHAVIIATRDVRRGLIGTGVEISAAIDDEEPAIELTGPTMGAIAPQPAAPAPDFEKLVTPLRTELRSLRAMVRGTTGESRVASELRAEVAALRKLVEQQLSGGQPPPPAAAMPVLAAQSAATRAAFARAAQPRERLVAPSVGRLVMLVGPTGAGKTTTIAKLAARASLVEHRSVSLITLDNYRVGGIDQIRTFADLIGVPLHVAESPGALASTIDPDDELTLIDTAGRSPRDTAAIAELAAHASGLGIETHLVVAAATPASLVDKLAARYAQLQPSRLLVTKLDEIDAAHDLALAPLRTGLPITWVTTGQAVPEDLEEPSAARLRELAEHGLLSNRGRAA